MIKMGIIIVFSLYQPINEPAGWLPDVIIQLLVILLNSNIN